MEDAQIAMTANSQCAGGCLFRGTWTGLGQHQPNEIQQGETWSPVLRVNDVSSPFPSVFLCLFLPSFPCCLPLNMAQVLYCPTGSSLPFHSESHRPVGISPPNGKSDLGSVNPHWKFSRLSSVMS